MVRTKTENQGLHTGLSAFLTAEVAMYQARLLMGRPILMSLFLLPSDWKPSIKVDSDLGLPPLSLEQSQRPVEASSLPCGTTRTQRSLGWGQLRIYPHNSAPSLDMWPPPQNMPFYTQTCTCTHIFLAPIFTLMSTMHCAKFIKHFLIDCHPHQSQ